MNQLTLHKFQSKDFDDYFRLVSNEAVMAMITERSIPLNEAKENFRRIVERNARLNEFGSYKVVDRITNQFVGFGSLILNEEQAVEAELGYMLLPEHWGKGYGSVIADLLIKKASNTTVNRLTAMIDPKNIASRKILIKKGFVSEKVCEIDELPGEILTREI
ncbi:GNAT family N-acetyltransferase [Mesobacillus subterraneus]|uniref:N-acetyltransferase n=1 Tax=Mesobacillus subterraneus TaxID=285983 RepID=A0A3R9E9F6_9BACI|nr:GNAT family N-acetyltransferase [Mesobacillus subterraneus]RSD28978.1 N-acetyltransferase [Mesobacillus subterraneus]